MFDLTSFHNNIEVQSYYKFLKCEINQKFIYDEKDIKFQVFNLTRSNKSTQN